MMGQPMMGQPMMGGPMMMQPPPMMVAQPMNVHTHTNTNTVVTIKEHGQDFNPGLYLGRSEATSGHCP